MGSSRVSLTALPRWAAWGAGAKPPAGRPPGFAEAAAAPEKSHSRRWADRFHEAMADFAFLPAGRILAGAGTGRDVTLFNCFVMGRIEDDLSAIFEGVKEGALTMQQGGGVGYDFSTLRPRGVQAAGVGSVASGPVSFMRIWDSMCATILSTGARRGAMMGTLRCDHPDIEEFIAAKQDRSQLRHFNISVLVSDAFMAAVSRDEDWPLVFPANESETGGELLVRTWSGYDNAVPCKVYKRIRARELWQKIMRANYDYAEPGVLFIDRINRLNNLYYCETIQTTNPCGEVPLPPYGACNLGSINLTQFVRDSFTAQARLDFDAIGATVATAVRLLDNVIDVSLFPLVRQAEQAQRSRRIAFAVAAGVGWALYIVITQHVGDRFAGVDGLAISLPVAAVVAATVGLPQAWGHLTLPVLAVDQSERRDMRATFRR